MASTRAADRLRAATLWTLCAVAMLTAFTAIVGTAETLSLQNVTYAQAYTGLYLLAQPAAAAVFLVSLVLASHHEPVTDLLGPPSPRRTVVLVLLGAPAALLGAELFLAGPEGPLLPGAAWILIKGAVVMGAVWLARRGFSVLAPGPRLAIAFAAIMVGLVNAGVTVLRAAP